MTARHESSKGRYREYLSRRKRAPESEAREAKRAGREGDRSGGTGIGESAGMRRRTRSFGALARAFWGHLDGWRWRVGAALLTLTVSACLGLVAPASTKFVIDYVLSESPGPNGIPDWARVTTDRVELLWLTGAGLVVLAVGGAGIGMVGRYQITRLNKLVQARMRRRVFGHVAALPLHRVQELKSGGVASILRQDAAGVGELLFSLIYNPWRAVVQLVGCLVVLAVTDWRMLAGAVVLMPTVWVSHKAWISRIRPVFQDIGKTRQHVDAHATEAFAGVRVVRAFGRARGEGARFQRNTDFMVRQEMLAWWWSRGVEIAWQLFIPVATTGVLVYGGGQVVDGALTIGDVMMFTAYLMMLLGPLEAIVSSATQMQQNLAGFDRVLDVLGEAREFEGERGEQEEGGGGAARVGGVGGRKRERGSSEIGGGGAARTGLAIGGRFSIRNVGFAYPGKTAKVLEGVTLEATAGATVALVGPSGAGKTTLSNLVARFYDPTEGEILIDGVDLREIDVAWYRRHLGVVEQDVFLFDGTIGENIAYARPGAGMGRVRAAARAAQADGFILETEKGYETLIGERGVRLSGGQKQRIAIARALLADPKVLILDEATSNLDTESEAAIQASLAGLMRGRTCFVIAHRLSTIRNADVIVVIDKGRIVETGTHEELSAHGGVYERMVRAQIGKPQDAAGSGAEE